MNITQIRNATQHITFGDRAFLIDSILAAKGVYSGFIGTACAEIRSPAVDLLVDIDTLLDVDTLIMTHLHEDHWDGFAARVVPKDKPIYVQNGRDVQVLWEQGFTQLVVLTQNTALGGITLCKAGGQHGLDRVYAVPQMAEHLGNACGVISQYSAEKTLYLVGSTIWHDEVEIDMRTFQPGVVILNAGFAYAIGFGPIIMGAEDVLKAHFTLPEAQIVVTRMEVINCCLLTRAALKKYTCDNQITQFANVPEDGETLTSQTPQRTCIQLLNISIVAVEDFNPFHLSVPCIIFNGKVAVEKRFEV